MTVQLTIARDPQDCRDTIYKLRLISGLKISTTMSSATRPRSTRTTS